MIYSTFIHLNGAIGKALFRRGICNQAFRVVVDGHCLMKGNEDQTMLADFSIWTLDDPQMRDDMQAIRDTLDERGVEYTMNRMSTTLEGSLTEISESIDACRQVLAVKHSRLLIQITFDDDRSK